MTRSRKFLSVLRLLRLVTKLHRACEGELQLEEVIEIAIDEAELRRRRRPRPQRPQNEEHER